MEETELKIAVMGLLWSFLRNERQIRHVARLRPGRNIVGVPTLEVIGEAMTRCGEKMLKEDFWIFITIALWKRIENGRR